MSPWEGLNRRRFPRVKYPCLVTIWMEDGSQKETFLTHTQNLGIGGICLKHDQRLKMQAKVSVEIDLMDMDGHIQCDARVVWVVQCKDHDKRKPMTFDVGLEFDNIAEDDRLRVSQIVQRLGKYPENIV